MWSPPGAGGNKPQHWVRRTGSECSTADDSSHGGSQLAMAGGVGAKDGGRQGEPKPGCCVRDHTLARQRVWAHAAASPAADSQREDNKSIWPCQRRTWWRGEREKRQSDGSPLALGSRLSVCRLLPFPAAGRGLCISSSSHVPS